MEHFVELRGVRKVYHMGEVEITAVDGIDFEIEKGEFAVIVGPSGAGKDDGAEYSGRNGHLYGGRGMGGRKRCGKVPGESS